MASRQQHPGAGAYQGGPGGGGGGGDRGVQFQGGAPKYIADFSKALAGEVRILLQEVGQLRDERQRLQREISDLLAVKAKHATPSGEYSADWMTEFQARLAIDAPPPPGMPPPPLPEDLVPIQAARPGWRRVNKKPDAPSSAVVARRRAGKSPAAASPPPLPPQEPPKQELPAWAQWKPNPMLAPTPRHGAQQPVAVAPPRGGLFGPSTPPPQ